MRTTKKTILGLALAAFLFGGCDMFEQLDDVTLDIEIQHTFHISETLDTDEPIFYFSESTIDAEQDENFKKYKDKIKEFTVHTITYTVTDVEEGADVEFTDGLGEFFATDGSNTAFASASIPAKNIGASEGQTHTLDYSTEDLNAIAQQLEHVSQVKFKVSGTLSHGPATFKVPVTLHCTIKADALD